MVREGGPALGTTRTADTPGWLAIEAESLLGPEGTQRSIAALEVAGGRRSRGGPGPGEARRPPARVRGEKADRGELAAARRLQERSAEQFGAALAIRPRHPEDVKSLRLCGENLPKVLVELGDHAAAARAIEELARDERGEAGDRGAIALQDANWLSRCTDLAEQDPTLSPEQRGATMRTYDERTRDLFEEAARLGADDVQVLRNLAGFLNTSPLSAWRKPERRWSSPNGRWNLRRSRPTPG